MKKIFIDCFNISSGGGLTHIKNILDVNKSSQIYIFASQELLNEIQNNKNIKKISHPLLNKSLIHRAYWHLFLSKYFFKKNNCDVAFYPGGINFSRISIFVTMSRNMLPFNISEILKYKSIKFKIKLLIIRLSQISTFKRSSGLIFLNNFAKQALKKYVGRNTLTTIIPHGYEISNPIKKTKLTSNKDKINFLYVSHFSPYKNHLNLIKAFKKLKHSYKNLNVHLTLIGSQDETFKDCEEFITKNSLDSLISIIGAVPHDELRNYYESCDVFIFPSSCENYPNILNEISDYSCDVICSYFQPMPSLLQDSSFYFNPLIVDDIVKVISFYMYEKKLHDSIKRNDEKKFIPTTWKNCSESTFKFIDEVANEYV